jgi:hypothetical protein
MNGECVYALSGWKYPADDVAWNCAFVRAAATAREDAECPEAECMMLATAGFIGFG